MYSEDIVKKVLQRIKNGEPLKEISADTNISLSTLYNWKKRFIDVEKEEIVCDSKEKLLPDDNILSYLNNLMQNHLYLKTIEECEKFQKNLLENDLTALDLV